MFGFRSTILSLEMGREKIMENSGNLLLIQGELRLFNMAIVNAIEG